MKIYTIWPCDKHGNPGADRRQEKRWLVLDVTAGLDEALQVAGPMTRWEALDTELKLRTEKP